MTLGEKIITIRKTHNLNQQQFAEKFHVTRQTVSNWENNKNYPDMSSLKMISDEYGVSFDELLKEDEAFIKNVDETKKKVSVFKRALLISLVILALVIAGFFIMLHIAFQPTPDGKRINSDTTIRMVVDLPDETPSRAITFTTDKTNNDKDFKIIVEKYEANSKGGVEGDIPCVILKDKPSIKLHFQDLDYNNILPENIISVQADISNVISDNQNKETVQLQYEYKNGNIIIDPGQIKYVSDPETGEVWYDVSLIVQYQYDGKDYTSITTLTVFDK